MFNLQSTDIRLETLNKSDQKKYITVYTLHCSVVYTLEKVIEAFKNRNLLKMENMTINKDFTGLQDCTQLHWKEFISTTVNKRNKKPTIQKNGRMMGG